MFDHEPPTRKLPLEPHALISPITALTLLESTQHAKAAYQRGDWTETERLCRVVLDAHAENFDALTLLGIVAAQTQRSQEAVALLSKAVSVNPGHAVAHANLGNVLHDLARYEDALESCNRALAIQPDNMEALYNCSAVLRELKRYQEALECCDHALSIQQDNADGLASRGTLLRLLGRHDAALASYDHALRIKFDDARTHEGRGTVLLELKRFDEAVASYNHALRIDRAHTDTHVNLAICLLHQGDFARGWDEYEWRWQTKKYRTAIIGLRAPVWEGEEVRGSLLVWNEQGLGDEIFYAGMLNDLKPYARSLTICIDRRLVGLFQRSFSDMQVISRQTLAADASFDRHIPIGSLGRYLRRDFRLLKDTTRPYLHACRSRAQKLRTDIAHGTRLLCGLSWISKSQATGADKSLRLQDLEPILNLTGIDFIDLQYGDTTQEQAALHATTKLQLVRVAEIDSFNDIDGLAALIEACDVIVTVSNTTAHLAAALGKPVLLMLPFSRGLLWYWHSERADSPWYPTVRIFRQLEFGDWRSVIDAVRQELRQRQASPGDATLAGRAWGRHQLRGMAPGSPSSPAEGRSGSLVPQAPLRKHKLLIGTIVLGILAILFFWLR